MGFDHNQIEASILEKCARHPILGHWCNDTPLPFSREFVASVDRLRFNETGDGLLVYEAKMFEQFNSNAGKPHWWIAVDELQKTRIFNRGDWQHYRVAIRQTARTTNSRTLVASILPRNTVVLSSVLVNVKDILSPRQALYLVGMLNSFVLDFLMRRHVTSNVSQFVLHQLPVPRLTERDVTFRLIAERSARLISITPDFDDLACEIGLRGHLDGVTNLFERSQIRTELDGLIAHLYGLTESEFVYILNTFPIVADPVKVAAQNAYRDVVRGLIK